MLDLTSFTGRWTYAPARIVLLGLFMLAFVAAGAGQAGATMRIEQHTDPAGDPTLFHYIESDPRGGSHSLFEFDLADGQHKDFGPFEGTFTAQAVVPPGWRVADIQCVGPSPALFQPDVANGRVTAQHGIADESSCAFTMRRIVAGVPPQPSPGVAPTQPPGGVAAAPAQTPAVLRVLAGRGSATAKVRVVRRSVIRGALLRGGRVIAVSRIVRNAGEHFAEVNLSTNTRRQLRRQGLRRVTLTLRIVVAEVGGATQVFRHRAIVRLV